MTQRVSQEASSWLVCKMTTAGKIGIIEKNIVNIDDFLFVILEYMNYEYRDSLSPKN